MFGLEFIGAFFVALVWWEIAIFAAIIIGMGFSLHEESSIGFGVAFIILASISWTGAGSLWAAVSLFDILYTIGIFLVAGIGWSFFKWRLLVASVIEHYKGKQYTKSDIKSRINDKKKYDTIVFWIVLWPFSALGYFLNDFIYDIVKRIVDKIYTVYDRITDSMLGKTDFADERFEGGN